MKRRSKSAGRAAKTSLRKPIKARQKSAIAPKVRATSSNDRQPDVARLQRELNEALEQQSATSEVLHVISSSRGDLELVFRTILEDATRICNANFGTLFRFDGEKFYPVAQFNTPAALLEAQAQRGPFQSEPGTAMEHVLRTKQVSHSADKAAEAAPGFFAEHGGARSQVAVPMLKDDLLIGVIVIYRQEVRPFTDKQINLVKNFAAQAVIAIENARLLNELRESLEQQTAAAEVLKVISSSPGELKPVFDTILESATRICEAKFGVLCSYDGNLFKYTAAWNAPPAFLEFMRQRGSFAPRAGTPLDRILKTKNIVHRADGSVEEVLTDTVRLAGAKSHLTVPMFKDEAIVGAIIIYRQEVRPFSEKQIALVQNFAAQAVIAIENARLLNELRESLAQQTATAEVLKVIARTPGELQSVFETMLAKATELCEASYGALWLRVDDGFRYAALHGDLPQIWTDHLRNGTVIRVRPDVPLARLLQTLRPVAIPDLRTDPGYLNGDPLPVSGVDIGGIRTLVVVPMIKNDDLVGAIAIYRKEVRPFVEKQVELVSNFAAQAVIAIENARLLNELRESLQQQTAASDVLRIISSSPGELEPVFQAMLANATRLCEAKFGMLYRFDGNAFHFAAEVSAPQEYADFNRQRGAFQPIPGGQLERLMLTKEVCHTPDDAAAVVPGVAARLAGARTQVIVPMLKDADLIGAVIIYRQEVRPFTDKQIELVKNFAAQAVIAIENARLLNELRESLEQQTASADVLRVISTSPGELEPVFEIMLDNATRICAAKFGTLYLYDGDLFHFGAEVGSPPEYAEFQRKRGAFRPAPGTHMDRIVRTKQISHAADAAAEAVVGPVVTIGGARTFLGVPMLKDNELIGMFGVYRHEVRPFTDKQIELVKNFAAQAVIAVENARLLRELRDRTHELELRSQEIAKLNQQLEARVADQVGEIERMGRLRRFLPPQVADLIVASGSERQLESHRREITALFCDLRGFTGFSESADPEDVMALLRQYHAAIGAIIIKYSGTLERYAGDGVMVVFNDPVPVDNPALQAVRMALDMRLALGALIEKWRRLGHELGFGIGIAHGYATLGTIGFEGRFDYAAIGTVSNVASRLCDEAKPGQILISPRVLMAVEDAISVEPVGDFALKGISRPLAAYNVVGAK
jgi:GAF domain-containing protein